MTNAFELHRQESVMGGHPTLEFFLSWNHKDIVWMGSHDLGSS